jgi:OmpA-OmpF porin, OOP family
MLQGPTRVMGVGVASALLAFGWAGVVHSREAGSPPIGHAVPAHAGLVAPVHRTAAAPPPGSPAPPAQTAAPAPAQPNLVEVKSDFVPGEQTLFYDDFTDMAGDEPPPHWRVRGGSVALRIGGGIRQLEATADRVRLTPALKQLPRNFTIETELKIDDAADARSLWFLHDKTWEGPTGPDPELAVMIQSREGGIGVRVRHKANGALEDVADASAALDLGQPFKESIWIQNGRLRVYVNDRRVVDVNQIELPPLAGAELYAEFGENRLGYRLVRVAESTPDFSQVMSASGRYVTHGILFDVDSDRLKPESAAVIRGVAQGLEKNPALKVRIEGHTDSTGNAAHNLDLSRRRAEAVRAVLISQFQIGADRLTTVGLGDSKPLESNDTPAGRAQNRRVEFVSL